MTEPRGHARGNRARHKLGETCPSCQTVHLTHDGKDACVGHSRDGSGRACTKLPEPGLPVCYSHGAGNPNAQQVGEQRAAEAKLEAAVRKLIPDVADRARITNPLETLLELASELNAFRESLRLKANDLDSIRYAASGAAGEQIRAEVSLYRQAIKDTTDLLVAIARLDIEKMLARIESRKVEMTIEALEHGCKQAGLDEEQKRTVMAGVARHLRALPRAS